MKLKALLTIALSGLITSSCSAQYIPNPDGQFFYPKSHINCAKKSYSPPGSAYSYKTMFCEDQTLMTSLPQPGSSEELTEGIYTLYRLEERPATKTMAAYYRSNFSSISVEQKTIVMTANWDPRGYRITETPTCKAPYDLTSQPESILEGCQVLNFFR
jgi:hypothetical protein